MKRQSELRSVSKEHAAKHETGHGMVPYTSEFGSIMSTLGSMERMLEESFKRPFWSPFRDIFREFGTAGEAYFYPTVDVYEQGNEVVVRCELPGMKRDDICVKFSDDSTLVISGERKSDEKIERSDYLRHECSYGTFKRIVNLSESCDYEKAKASYKDGVLEIRIPRSEEKSKAWTVPIS
jgi:HSP20 family protein